ncbi:MAG: hypothetical protein K0R80_1942 [Clostridia bacterium]|jgi:hypothetical protein|nr:hypothetical protein [Clostridia bacterium]MDF2891575.1 hypothetical protein [Clostridia bacterium]HYE09176.1 hypothetical protein [Patescibacteria group bacterium]
MKRIKASIYDAHLDYDAAIDVELLNMKIKIYGEDYEQTGKVFYEGSIGKFIKERIPSDFLVDLLTELRHKDKVSYRLSGGENFIERIR